MTRRLSRRQLLDDLAYQTARADSLAVDVETLHRIVAETIARWQESEALALPAGLAARQRDTALSHLLDARNRLDADELAAHYERCCVNEAEAALRHPQEWC